MILSTTEQALIQLTSAGLGFNQNVRELPDEIHWAELFEMANRQGVSAICLDGLQSDEAYIRRFKQMPSKMIKLKLQWLGQALQMEHLNKKRWNTVCELSELWKRNGIDTVVLKGFSLCQYYPNELHRYCGDFDCFLLNGQYEKGNVVVENRGIKVDRGQYKHATFIYKGTNVENHHYLISVRGSKKNKKLERYLENLLADSKMKNLCMANKESLLLCPSEKFMALFLVKHTLVHFLNERVSLRQICDWLMFRKSVPAEYWSSIEESMERFGLQRMYIVMNNLASLIEGSLQLEELKIHDQMVLTDIFRSEVDGVFDVSWKTRIRGMKNMFQSSWKYREFTGDSAINHIRKVAFGFLFDRKPKI